MIHAKEFTNGIDHLVRLFVNNHYDVTVRIIPTAKNPEPVPLYDYKPQKQVSSWVLHNFKLQENTVKIYRLGATGK